MKKVTLALLTLLFLSFSIYSQNNETPAQKQSELTGIIVYNFVR